MKNNWILLLVSCWMVFGFASCSDNADTTWRDKNLSYFDNLKTKTGILELGDSLNGKPGIFYEVIQAGTGVKPIIGNQVNVSYKGCLYNDTTSFDSSSDFTFTVGSSVIEGWNLVIQSMPVGAKWRVYLPYYLAYGSTAKTNIPAYSTLIFELYLRKIESQN